MLKDKLTLNLNSIVKQRNCALLISLILLISNLLLSIFCVFKDEKTIIVPTSLNKSISYGSFSGFSVSYLEEMTYYFLHLLLNVNSSNLKYSANLLMRHVQASSYQSLAQYYSKQLEEYSKILLSTSFIPKAMDLDETNLKVKIRGNLISYISNKFSSQQEKTYVLEYVNQNGTLLIKKFGAYNEAENN